jgi:hypothetical protein
MTESNAGNISPFPRDATDGKSLFESWLHLNGLFDTACGEIQSAINITRDVRKNFASNNEYYPVFSRILEKMDSIINTLKEAKRIGGINNSLAVNILSAINTKQEDCRVFDITGMMTKDNSLTNGAMSTLGISGGKRIFESPFQADDEIDDDTNE